MGLRDSLTKATPKPADSSDGIDPLSNLGDFPIANYTFTIKIDNLPVAFFQKVSGMTVERKFDEWSDGGHNEYTLEFPREFSYSHITFKAGLSSSDFFYKWMMYGKEQGIAYGKNFVLEQKYPDKPADVPKSWSFFGAFPVRWTISDLDITDSKTIVIETLELSFNYFQLD